MKQSHFIIAIALLASLTGCRQKMENQPRYEAYEASALFEDSTSARPLPEGVVARGKMPPGAAFEDANPYYGEEGDYAGAGQGEGYEARLTTEMPFPVTRRVLERGQGQFNVYCSPCHGRLGNGQGMIVQRGLRKPASFHTERLRNAPIGHFYNVITNGYGAMYSYAARVKREDRWAIAAYIRALQLSQNATMQDIPQDKRNEMQVISTAPADTVTAP
jgi:mono/diheme cytochrome c family protein